MGSRAFSRRFRAISLAIAGIAFAGDVRTTHAVSWVNPSGGSFHTASNWSPAAPPGAGESAIFNLNDPGYIVTLSSSVSNGLLQVRNDKVQLSLSSGVTYTTTQSSDSIQVGFAAGDDARLSMSGGSGTFSSTNARVGPSGSNAELDVFFTTWNNSGAINIGSSGTGHLEVTSGADITTGSLLFGVGSSGTGSGRIAQSSSTVHATFLTVGDSTTGSLLVELAGTLSGQTATLGNNLGSNGTVTINGSGRWNLSGGVFNIGRMGTGTVIVEDGGVVTGPGINMAGFDTGNGNITITGPGSAWDSTGGVFVGVAGSASLTISSGGTCTTTTGNVGSGGNGTVLVTGGSSLWDLSNTLTVGGSGVGSLTIQNGGRVEALTVNVGENTGSRGTLSLTGAASTLTALGNMNVGGGTGVAGGTGTFTVNTATTASIAGTLRVWPAGTVNLSGGTLNAGALAMAGGFFNFFSGTLNLTNSILTVGAGPLGSTVQLGGNQTVSATGVTVEPGALLILNGGSISATSSTQNFNNNGEVQLNGPTSLIGGRPLINNGLLIGNGRIATTSTTNAAAGEFRVAGADRLLFTGAVTNAGQINLFNGGTAEFGGTLTNQASGRINGRGILISHGTLTNQGQMSFSGGFSDVLAPITNSSGAKIIVTGGGVTTFYNPITHNAGADIRASVGSMAIFLGDVTGAGTFSGGGTLVFETTNTVIGAVETPGATVVESAAFVMADHFKQNALTVNGTVTIASGGGTSHLNELHIDGKPDEWDGVVDLKNNSLVLEAGDLALITNQIKSGLYGSTGITSSAPAAPFRLGSMSNAGTIYSSFQGISGLDGDEVLIRYTRIGDLNLDGTVTISDFIDLAAHFDQTNATWQMGDVNYDGSVTISDFIDLASNFNQSVSGEALPISDEDAAMLAAFGAENGASAVPEPTCLLLVLVTPILILPRRRKLPLASPDVCGVP